MKKFVALTLLIFLFTASLKAQKDNSFWFAAPDIEIVNHPIYGEFDRPIYMRLTSFTSPATVTISIPANPAFVPVSVNIPANSTSTVNLTPWIDLIENSDPANVANKGIYIQSTSDITAYYEINSTTCNCNPELLALKGKNALGNEFYVPSQLTWAVDTVRHPNARAGFDLVATQNNTTVTITPAKPLIGHPAGVPFTITLNKGQSYACIALYRNGSSMLNGSKVAADKPIAVSSYEDVLFSDGACADLAADQLVPTNIFGTEFAVVRGDLAVRDKVIITASQSSTSIYLNGNAAPVATINAGQSYEYDLLPATPVLYITTSKPVGVYHYTGSGCEVGAAAIPKLTCTGSTSVSLVRTSNGGNASVMLVTKAANQGNFLVNGVAGIITAADFAPVPGSGGVYVYAKKDITASMPLNIATTFSNTTGKFQLGFFNMTASNGGCMYGFFSDFKKSNVTNSQLELCRLDSVQLNALGGVTYQWSPATGLSNPNISNPKASPAVTTDYKVVITDGDGCVDSAFVKVVVNVCSANSSIINTYTPVQALNPCTNALTVEDASTFNTGDTVLLIQMKGAIIDSTNSAAFGTITDYKNAGNYEFNYVKSKTGNIIELKNILTRQYDIPVGKVQLVRVPYYINFNTTDTLTCLPWDGNKGGVLVFNVQNTLTLNQPLDVSGKGFKGAPGYNPGNASLTCNQNSYNYPTNTLFAAQKGESITTISNNIICGKGSPAGGGGGGLGHNSGGGGGGNGGVGGFGGYQLEPCGNAPFDNRGIGGKPLAYSTAANRIFMGSGGGAGHADNPGNIPPGGGNGAGIIIVSADKIQSNAMKILANGGNAVTCSIPSSPDCHDAMGGGGAGGTVLLSINQYLDNAGVENKGGKGADVIGGPISIAGRIGPGGGGGGGLAFLKSATVPANLAISNAGGVNGVMTQDANNAWGATTGTSGQNIFNLVLPVDNTPFQKNIDSVRIKDSLLNCNGFDFKGRAYINNAPITSWQWYFGDGGQATTQNTSYAYLVAGTYTVKLIVTDQNGCKDSSSVIVNALPGVSAEAGSDTSACTNSSVSATLHGTAVGGPYSWSPAIYLNNPTIQNPIATVSSTTTFYLNVTGAASCTAVDSVTIYINPLPLVDARKDTAICRFSPLVLTTVSNAVSYSWTPAIYVSNPTIANPNYIDNFSHKVFVTGTSAAGCQATDSVDVTVNPLPQVQTIPDTTVCISTSITLTTTGAQTYSWTPAAGLSNPNIANPVFNNNTGNTYTVVGTDINGCKNTDQVRIIISSPDSLKQPPGFTICQQQSVMLDGNNGTRVSYLWSPATYLSNATIINPVANPPQTTVYRLLVTDNKCGFDSLFTTTLTVLPAPFVTVTKSNDIDCALKSARLTATGGNQYLWTPATGLSNPAIPNPVATPTSTQTYTVLVTDAAGCTNTGSINVFADNTASLARYMPNAFTPDGNGNNDCYGLKRWMYIKRLEFIIFNRYGEQVFATANPNECWDGTYKGKPALAGTYVYYIKAQTDCGEEIQKGNFLLIR